MAELVNMVRDSCREIQLELRAQAVVKNIRDFDGEGSKRFREWLREVERAGNSVGADSDRLKAFASQTLRGVASDFLTRIVSQKPAITWAELRRLLVAQFSDTGDSYLAQAKLTKLKQLKGESIQNFCERIFALAEEAYVGQDLASPVIQSILVDTLIRGALSDHLSKALIKNKPKTLDAALEVALREQTDSKSFELRRRQEEPMDVSVVNSHNGTLDSKLDKIAGGLIQLGDKFEQILAVQANQRPNQHNRSNVRQLPPQGAQLHANYRPRPQGFENAQRRPQNDFRPNYEWSADGKPICHFCRNIGHTQNKCRKKRFQTAQNSKN